MKTFLIGMAFLAIFASLGSALFFMMRKSEGEADDGSADDSMRARRMWLSLALRIGLSIALFVCILLAWEMGWIAPSGIPAGR